MSRAVYPTNVLDGLFKKRDEEQSSSIPVLPITFVPPEKKLPFPPINDDLLSGKADFAEWANSGSDMTFSEWLDAGKPSSSSSSSSSSPFDLASAGGPLEGLGEKLSSVIPGIEESSIGNVIQNLPNPVTQVIQSNNVPITKPPMTPPPAPQYTQTTPMTRPEPKPAMPKPKPAMPKPSPAMPKPKPAMPKPSPAMSVRDIAKNNNMKKVDEYQSKTDQLQAAVEKLRRK